MHMQLQCLDMNTVHMSLAPGTCMREGVTVTSIHLFMNKQQQQQAQDLGFGSNQN